MKFYNASRTLHLETDASGVSIGAGFLQVRDSMNCVDDEVSDNATLYLIASTRKSISSAQWHYSNIEC